MPENHVIGERFALRGPRRSIGPASRLVEYARARGVLPVVPRQQPVELGVFGLERARLHEQRLAANGEEFGGVVGGIGVDQRFAFETSPPSLGYRIDLRAEPVVGGI